jgi:hypothetical protein
MSGRFVRSRVIEFTLGCCVLCGREQASGGGHMTAQTPDILIFEEEEVDLFANPPDQYLARWEKGWPFFSSSTANYRGYIATWEIRNGDLLLVKLRGWIATHPIDVDHPMKMGLQDNLKAMPEEWKRKLRNLGERTEAEVWKEVLWGAEVPLTFLFPETSGPIKASWYSGTMRVPRGKLLRHDGGYASTYERELLITIEEGVLVHTTEVDNVPAFLELMREVLARIVGAPKTGADGWRRALQELVVAGNLQRASEHLDFYNQRRLEDLVEKVGLERFQELARDALARAD